MVLGFDRLDLIAPPIAAGTNLVSPCIYIVLRIITFYKPETYCRAAYTRETLQPSQCTLQRYATVTDTVQTTQALLQAQSTNIFLEKRLNIE